MDGQIRRRRCCRKMIGNNVDEERGGHKGHLMRLEPGNDLNPPLPEEMVLNSFN